MNEPRSPRVTPVHLVNSVSRTSCKYDRQAGVWGRNRQARPQRTFDNKSRLTTHMPYADSTSGFVGTRNEHGRVDLDSHS